MRKIGLILPCLCLALVSFTAKADTLELISTPGGGAVGPYDMLLNGTTTLELFCLNDLNKIKPTESWGVNILLGSALTSANIPAGTTVLDFEEEAFILSQFNGSNNTTVQDAIWGLFDSGAPSTSASAALLTLAEASTGAGHDFISSGGFDNYLFYFYDGGTVTNPNCAPTVACPPQNFIGDPTPNSTTPTPEPSSLFLLGSALLGLAGVARRKLVRR